MINLLIQNGSQTYAPVVADGVSWEIERKGSPGKLSFKVLKDGVINFQEGNTVTMNVDGTDVFYGFVFSKNRSKEQFIQVTAYDQLRYFKNKDTYTYTNKTAAEVIQMITADFGFQIGSLEDTTFKIAERVEDNKTLFDIVQTALDLTLQNKKQLYVLFDNFGKLTLKSIQNMKLDVLIHEATIADFDYTSGIDGETYNKIKLAYANKATGKQDIYIAKDTNNINKWGILQYFETIQESGNAKTKADALLSLYNCKTRNLSVKNAFGDIRVRAGSLLPVHLSLGDVTVNNYMLVEKVKHVFQDHLHTMDLTLRGGGFIA